MASEEEAQAEVETKMETEAETETPENEDERKLFVGGLPQDAKENDVRSHFETFGEIQTVNLKTDPNTGRSRGFAFVVYKASSTLEKAVAQAEHLIKGKAVAVKKAQAKQGKVYVGKLKGENTEEDIKEFFTTFGTVVSVEHPYDKVKGEKKNFCFVTFEKEETAKKLLKDGTVNFKGNELDIKKVTPKADPRMMQGPMYNQRGRGGHQGAWGGHQGQGYGWGGGQGDYGWGGGQGGYGGYGYDSYYGGGGGWGGYGQSQGHWGGYGQGQGQGGGAYSGGKSPRGRGAPRGRGGRGQRQKPY